MPANRGGVGRHEGCQTGQRWWVSSGKSFQQFVNASSSNEYDDNDDEALKLGLRVQVLRILRVGFIVRWFLFGDDRAFGWGKGGGSKWTTIDCIGRFGQRGFWHDHGILSNCNPKIKIFYKNTSILIIPYKTFWTSVVSVFTTLLKHSSSDCN